MAEVGFINSGLQNQLHQNGQLVQPNPAANNNASDTRSENGSSTVSISTQAQLIQKTGELSTSQQNSRPVQASQETAQDSVRVSSSLGKAASSVGLTEQEAIKLYEAIKDLI
ncbi:hypothetical protein DS2_05325 [Catenovulum agarivorans DS-2]|uniref:Uncharacterized protein n=1 Tax=Catenovulum agarivorans DS-2 TaxID=1328313 RepID=W7QQI3_9ALTE|nr:hypothetical protein [Catenovulum agarivorans]EWH11252.1 hypothetical protein DS2_05325 [Catenovulum agarivorans DS-2]